MARKISLYDRAMQGDIVGNNILVNWVGRDKYGRFVDIHSIGVGYKESLQWECERGHRGNLAVHTKFKRFKNGEQCKKCIKDDRRMGLSRDEVEVTCDSGHTYKTYSSSYKLGYKKCPYCNIANIDKSRELEFSGIKLVKDLGREEIDDIIKHCNMDYTKLENKYTNDRETIQFTCKYGHRYDTNLFNFIHDKENNRCNICERYTNRKKFSDWCLSEDSGEYGNRLLREFTGEAIDGERYKSGDLLLTSKIQLKWRCDRGHEFINSIYLRTRQVYKKAGTHQTESTCPYCTGRKVDSSNNLSTYIDIMHLDYIREQFTGLDIQGNRVCNIDDISYKSNKKLKWRCNNNHEYNQTVKEVIDNTVKYEHACPICRKQLWYYFEYDKLHGDELELEFTGIDGQGKLVDKFINMVSDKVLKWRCRRGHEWNARLDERVLRFRNACPICKKNGGKFIDWCENNRPYSDLLLSEWAGVDRNGTKHSLMVVDIENGNGMKWVCKKCGKHWYETLLHRIKNRNTCPYCTVRK